MDAERFPDADGAASSVAAAIGEPARARMLFCLLDGRARTSTELALTASVAPSTASIHLSRLKAEGLVDVLIQGKHRYYSLGGPEVATVLEALSVLTRHTQHRFDSATPHRLRAARTCYDHIAGALGVALHDRLMESGWISARPSSKGRDYELTPKGTESLIALGVDLDGAPDSRRRFAFGCLDWSERRVHLGGALGAAILDHALSKKWVTRERNGRGLSVSGIGRRALQTHFDIRS